MYQLAEVFSEPFGEEVCPPGLVVDVPDQGVLDRDPPAGHVGAVRAADRTSSMGQRVFTGTRVSRSSSSATRRSR